MEINAGTFIPFSGSMLASASFDDCLKHGILEHPSDRATMADLLQFPTNRRGDQPIISHKYMAEGLANRSVESTEITGICGTREKAKRGAECSSTYCSLEEVGISPPYMQKRSM